MAAHISGVQPKPGATFDRRIIGVSALVPPLQDIYNLRNEKSISSGDIAQQFTFTHRVELPMGRGKVLGGWALSGTATFSSGYPLSLTSSGNPGVGNTTLRPNNNGTSPAAKWAGGARLSRYFKTTEFSIPPQFTFGAVSRTLPDVRGPGRIN
jgi:hypothetical protein